MIFAMSLLLTFDSSNPLTQHQQHADSNVSQFPREEVCDILEELLPLLLNWFLQAALAAAFRGMTSKIPAVRLLSYIWGL